MSDMTLRQALSRAAAAQWIAKIAKEGMSEAKAVIMAELLPGDRMHANLAGANVGTISVSDPKEVEKLEVTDMKAFTEWVKKNHPEAIVEAVADWFAGEGNLKALVAKDGEFPDGVELVTTRRDPTVSVRVSSAQAESLAIIAQGETLKGVLEA